jgi:hypothetical protein
MMEMFNLSMQQQGMGMGMVEMQRIQKYEFLAQNAVMLMMLCFG